MSETLTDEHHDWASNFCGIPTQDPPEPTQSAEPAEPNQSIQAPEPEPEPIQSVAPPKPNQSVEPEPNQSVQPPPEPTAYVAPQEPNQFFATPAGPDQSVQLAEAANGDAGAGATLDAAPPSSAGVATIEFNAFIPGSLGSKFSSFAHPKDLKNQATFDAALGAVPGTWLEEPGSFAGLSSGPWLFSTDDRGFGGGSHRVGSKGSINTADIGAMKSKGGVFKHTTSGSSHGRWVHTGTFTSSNETGSLDGPVSKPSKISGTQSYTDPSSDSSVLTLAASGSYPFATVAPDIDYKLVLTISRDAAGKVTVSGDITTNKFPFYELLINGSPVWSFSSTDKGPTLSNLSSSITNKLAPVKL